MQLPSKPPQHSADIEAEVELVDAVPVARKQYRLSEEMKRTIREWVREMLDAGIIRPSKSPYSSPTFCVRKAVGWRIVHDFRAINSKIRIPATPVPRKEDIFDAMANGYWFSALDLLWGFFQVRLHESDIPYTAFSTPDGQFEYLVTPMGLSCSPAAFNRLMQHAFSDQNAFCQAYFDDLPHPFRIIYRSWTRCYNVAKIKDFTLSLQKEIPCLGDYLGRDQVRMNPDKTKRDLQSFLKTCVYVLKFCENYAELSAPLVEVTKGKTAQERIHLTQKQLVCLTKLKVKLTEPPVLAHPDSTKAFCVRMDPSDYAVGGYLYRLNVEGNERRRVDVSYKRKKQLAALHAMRVWRVYLIDKPFFVNTDHRTLKSILDQKPVPNA
ncbi:Reverse transcriptase [Phytophthora palmivora]|uniref:Reverse transcriptase n=1 Tax=Phytophthora palmivora TaxID=4796 RepID=A0A2P4XUQ9_9STRA|nr:Reverse transcriptase [Phytophthora palmivora]